MQWFKSVYDNVVHYVETLLLISGQLQEGETILLSRLFNLGIEMKMYSLLSHHRKKMLGS